MQNDLPVLTDFDKQAIACLCTEFEVDFISLSYCRSVEDVQECREFLAAIGQDQTKVRWCLRFWDAVGAGEGGSVGRSGVAAGGEDVLGMQLLLLLLLRPPPRALLHHTHQFTGSLNSLAFNSTHRNHSNHLSHLLTPHTPQVIAKCETRQSLFNFRALVDACDAIIISRGNLGLDVVPEKMAMVQVGKGCAGGAGRVVCGVGEGTRSGEPLQRCCR